MNSNSKPTYLEILVFKYLSTARRVLGDRSVIRLFSVPSLLATRGVV